MMKKDGMIGIFEDSDGVFSIPKLQAVAFTILLMVMISANLFWDKQPSYEAWAIATLGAGIGAVEMINDRRKVIKLKSNDNKKGSN